MLQVGGLGLAPESLWKGKAARITEAKGGEKSLKDQMKENKMQINVQGLHIDVRCSRTHS